MKLQDKPQLGKITGFRCSKYHTLTPNDRSITPVSLVHGGQN